MDVKRVQELGFRVEGLGLRDCSIERLLRTVLKGSGR